MVGTYKTKRIFIPDPENCKDWRGHQLKSPGFAHYDIAQNIFMNTFFKEKYGLSITKPDEEEKIIEKGLLERYSEDKDEEGLTPSERYKVEYANRFLYGKFKIAEDDREWAENLEKMADEIKESLQKRKMPKRTLLEGMLNTKAAAILFVFSIGLFILSAFLRISTTGYAVSEGLGAGDYSMVLALIFFIAGIIVFILAGKKEKL